MEKNITEKMPAQQQAKTTNEQVYILLALLVLSAMTSAYSNSF